MAKNCQKEPLNITIFRTDFFATEQNTERRTLLWRKNDRERGCECDCWPDYANLCFIYFPIFFEWKEFALCVRGHFLRLLNIGMYGFIVHSVCVCVCVCVCRVRSQLGEEQGQI